MAFPSPLYYNRYDHAQTNPQKAKGKPKWNIPHTMTHRSES